MQANLSTMPIYIMMADKLPPWVIREIDGIRRNFLWTGTNATCRGKSAVAWPTVCPSTLYDGLAALVSSTSGSPGLPCALGGYGSSALMGTELGLLCRKGLS